MKAKISIFRQYVVYHIIWPLAFLLGCLLPRDKKLAVFAYNRTYHTLPDNMIPIKKIYEENGWHCVEYGNDKGALQRLIGDIRFQFIYARSAVVFITDNFDPVYAHKPRKGSRVVQLWHACGAFKKWGYSSLDYNWAGNKKIWLLCPRYRNFTDVFVSSKAVIPCYAEAFNCSEDIIKPFGTPRTDVFFDKDFVSSGRKKLCSLIPEIGDRKIILYAPTFRGNSYTEAHNDKMIDYRKLRNALKDKYVLVLKFHPFTYGQEHLNEEEKKECADFVFMCPDEIKIDTALCAADMVISDYSSLVFEYSLLQRPMIFFAYDYEEYNRDRSYYFDYESFVPGPIVKNDDELLETVLRGADMEKVAAFREKFMSGCDGNSSRRIAEYTMKPNI